MVEVERGAEIKGRVIEGSFWTDAICFTALVVLAVLSPILIPLHFILTHQGRRGIFVMKGEGEEKELWVLVSDEVFDKIAR